MNEETFREYVIEKLDAVDEFINGNGKPGIKVRVDRLEQAKKVAGWVLGVIIAPLAVAAGVFVIGRLMK